MEIKEFKEKIKCKILGVFYKDIYQTIRNTCLIYLII